MIIFGYKGIEFPRFKKITSIEEIMNVDNTCIVWFDREDDINHIISNHCLQNDVKYAIKVDNLTDFVVYASLGARYAILDKTPEIYQKIAEVYLFDMKILYTIKDKSEIEELVKMGIDGVIFREILE
ncbi:hypothetical protein [Helicobacter cappadocius]|uniref:Uncharacterized protein n=1 Tax=Helicobacter cappadocius TaxID=3063998 RepID=A0AA90PWH2_9HELI|nr:MULTISPECIES: hypothetical protein [unclassified Helicobacter]MDO7253662.1 hypothetical protein [Helicobacter sp. faydin-H75]MDP2539590.1 hypothetical protein [Helicobacter sp. faydin-H76]